MQLTYSYVFRIILSKKTGLNVGGKTPTLLLNPFCSNVAKQDARFVARFTKV